VRWPGIDIVGLFSRTQKTVDEVLAEWPIQFGTTSLEELLERQPQAAFVLTANASHFDLTRQLLEAGIDVCLEKPATETSASARELADLAKERGRVFMVTNRLRAALPAGKEIFGSRRIQLFVVEKHRPSAFHPNLYKNYLDDTIHQIDLLRFFCGEVKPVHTSHELRGDKMAGALSVVELIGGGLGLVSTSLAAGAWQEKVTLHGDGLTVEVSAFRELRVKYRDHEEVYGLDRPGRWLRAQRARLFRGHRALLRLRAYPADAPNRRLRGCPHPGAGGGDGGLRWVDCFTVP
jgi:virulence factor